MDEILTKLSRGYKVGSGGAAVAILSFFLPWVLVSCSGQQVRMSGWQLAAGATAGEGYGAQQTSGDPLLFLVLFAGIGVLALAYRAYERGKVTQADGYGLIGLGALPLAILLYRFSGLQDQAALYGFVVRYQLGFWGVVVGYIAVVIGGIMDLVELGKAAGRPRYPTPDIPDRRWGGTPTYSPTEPLPPPSGSIYSPTEPLSPPSRERSHSNQGGQWPSGTDLTQGGEEPTDSADEGYIWRQID